MNRNQSSITGMFLAIVMMVMLLSACSPSAPADGDPGTVLPLGYCTDDQVLPCVVSFSADAWDNMLINLLLPDLSFPPFQLRIVRGETEITYACQRLTGGVNNAYCAGPKLPPGEILTLKLVASDDGTLLAQGDLSIIGLALPTISIAVVTPQKTQTASATGLPTLTPTAFSLLVLPPSTETPTSYPNPSYPNPSYPNSSYP